jgi:transposase-like protein
MILTLDRIFKQLEPWGQDPEDSRYGDLSDLVISNLKWVLELSFEYEASHRTGCFPHQRSGERRDYRNGYRVRDILTRFGRLKDVQIPRLRKSGFVPSLLTPGRIALHDVEELVAKCLLSGASRSEVIEMLTLVFGYPPSGSIIARVQSQLDVQAREFQNRPLTKKYKYLFLDGLVVKVKEGRLAQECVVLIAIGIDADGVKEVIGYLRASKETGAAWRRLLNGVVERGFDYEAMELVISDDSPAIALAIDDVFGDVDHQLCWAHRMTNLEKTAAEKDRAECVADMRQVYQAPNRPAAIRAYVAWKDKWGARYPRFTNEMEKDLGKLLNFYKCPEAHWTYVRTNNPIERLNGDIRARTYGWAGFQNKESCIRLLYGLFWQRNKQWSTDPKIEITH